MTSRVIVHDEIAAAQGSSVRDAIDDWGKAPLGSRQMIKPPSGPSARTSRAPSPEASSRPSGNTSQIRSNPDDMDQGQQLALEVSLVASGVLSGTHDAPAVVVAGPTRARAARDDQHEGSVDLEGWRAAGPAAGGRRGSQSRAQSVSFGGVHHMQEADPRGQDRCMSITSQVDVSPSPIRAGTQAFLLGHRHGASTPSSIDEEMQTAHASAPPSAQEARAGGLERNMSLTSQREEAAPSPTRVATQAFVKGPRCGTPSQEAALNVSQPFDRSPARLVTANRSSESEFGGSPVFGDFQPDFPDCAEGEGSDDLVSFLVAAAASERNVRNATEFLDWIDDRCPVVKRYFVKNSVKTKSLFRTAVAHCEPAAANGLSGPSRAIRAAPRFSEAMPSGLYSQQTVDMSGLCRQQSVEMSRLSVSALSSSRMPAASFLSARRTVRASKPPPSPRGLSPAAVSEPSSGTFVASATVVATPADAGDSLGSAASAAVSGSISGPGLELPPTPAVASNGLRKNGQTLAEKLQKTLKRVKTINKFVAAGSAGANDPTQLEPAAGERSGSLSEDVSVKVGPLIYSTPDQSARDAKTKLWAPVTTAQQLILMCVFLYNFALVPIRMAVGSNELPRQALDIWEGVLDLVTMLALGLNFFLPVDIDGRIEVKQDVLWRRYLHGGFAFDALTVFPAQILLIPLWSTGHLGMAAVDFARVNRLLGVFRFTDLFDDLAEKLLPNVHPTITRIIKFTYLIMFYAMATAVPVYIGVRTDYASNNEWLGLTAGDTINNYLEVFMLTLNIESGRNYSYPKTEAQHGVMLILAILSLFSTSVIITGVVSMVGALVARSSQLSDKIDGVLQELSYRRVEGPLTEEIVSYYFHMHRIFQTFDYNCTADFFDELPLELRAELENEMSKATIRSLPLFADVVDDQRFVSQMAERLILYVLMPGTAIVTFGDDGDDMFFISKGAASVITGAGQIVATLRDGSFFGELALLFGTRRTATIRTTTLCQVFALSRAAFEEMIDIRPDALQKILDVTMARREQNEEVRRGLEALRRRASKRHLSVAPTDGSAMNNGPSPVNNLAADSQASFAPQPSQAMMDRGDSLCFAESVLLPPPSSHPRASQPDIGLFKPTILPEDFSAPPEERGVNSGSRTVAFRPGGSGSGSGNLAAPAAPAGNQSFGSSGVVSNGHALSSLAGSGLAGSGLAASGLAASGLAASGLVSNGRASSSLAASGLVSNGRALSSLAGSGLAASGRAGSGLAGSGSDRVVVDPAPASVNEACPQQVSSQVPNPFAAPPS